MFMTGGRASLSGDVMPYFRDTIHTQAFRAMFRRLPSYTLHNLRASLKAEAVRVREEYQAGFTERTQVGVAHHDRMAMNPAIDGLTPLPEAETGTIVARNA